MADNCSKLMKDAIDGAVNESRGIDMRYKLDDVLESLGPKQKFNPEQLKGYLLKQGVSPYEIEASQMFKGFEGDNRAISAEDWLSMSGNQRVNTFRVAPEDAQFGDITLDKKGASDASNYREILSTVKKPENNAPVTTHFSDEISTPRESLLGWRRTHVDTINGKKTLVLNEFQSDWAQTERAGRGTFESKSEIKRLSKEEESLRLSLKDKINGIIKDYNRANPGNEIYVTDDLVEKDLISIEEATRYKDLDIRNQQINNAKLTADFPMSEIKHHQFQIVGAIDDALKQGIDTIAIPIQRENELLGSAGVTKFYESLNKKVLPDIRKKLEKQGMRIKVDKVPYTSGEGNELWRLTAEEIPNKKVNWDVYGLIGALGLSQYAKEGEDNASRNIE